MIAVVPNVTGTTNNLTEEKVAEKAFELIFAFDEVITYGGYKEAITLAQIRTNMEMESHEEKLHDMIKKSKMESAREQSASAANLIRDRQKAQQRLGVNSLGGGSSSNYGSEGSSGRDATFGDQSYTPTPVVQQQATPTVTSSRGNAQHSVKGMQLGGGGKNKSVEDALMKEDNLVPVHLKAASKLPESSSSMVQPAAHAVQHPIMMVVSEKVSANISRDGVLDLFEIKGSLTLTAATDEAALCSVQLNQSNTDIFQFNTHPKVNKALYEKSGLLQLKDPSKGFPSVRPVGILKWNYSGTGNDELVPIKINCWPEEESRGRMNVSIEYTMDLQEIELHDVRIRIPLGTSETPTILSVDGSHKHNSQAGELVWEISLIDKSNSSGSLEFHIQQRNADAFFPISVQFSSQQLYCNVDVASVKAVGSGATIPYGLSRGMSSEDYVIG